MIWQETYGNGVRTGTTVIPHLLEPTPESGSECSEVVVGSAMKYTVVRLSAAAPLLNSAATNLDPVWCSPSNDILQKKS